MDCYPKMSKHNFSKNYFERLHLKQNLFFSLFKSKNCRETTQKSFSPVQIKNRLNHFWKFFKNTKQLLISNFILGDCSLCIKIILGDCSLMFKDGFCKFSQKIFIFEFPSIFETENFSARAQRNLPISLEFTS